MQTTPVSDPYSFGISRKGYVMREAEGDSAGMHSGHPHQLALGVLAGAVTKREERLRGVEHRVSRLPGGEVTDRRLPAIACLRDFGLRVAPGGEFADNLFPVHAP